MGLFWVPRYGDGQDPVFQPQTVTGQPQGTDPPIPSRQYLCTHSPGVHTLTRAPPPSCLPVHTHHARSAGAMVCALPVGPSVLSSCPLPQDSLHSACHSLQGQAWGPPGTGQLSSELDSQQ